MSAVVIIITMRSRMLITITSITTTALLEDGER